MASIDEFKSFVRKNPSLTKYIKNGEMTWQKFYEMYDLYGENNEIWNTYIKKTISTAAAFDIFSFLKNIDLDSIQNGVNSLQRVLGVVQDFSNGKKEEVKEEYKPRPLYKHFDD